jgi:esterase
VIHGIMGSGRNWATMTRRLLDALPNWVFVSVDLRGHGDSHDQAKPDSISACATDLYELAQHLGREPRAVIGHSFGGKVALEYACRNPPFLQQVWCLDSSPSALTHETTAMVDAVLKAAQEVVQPVAHRLAMVPYFESKGFSRSVGAWMTTNLKRVDNGFVWRFDLERIQTLLDDYRAVDYWPYLEDCERTVTVNWILASRSTWWQDSTVERLRRLHNSRVDVLPDSGHWVHIDNPVGLLKLVRERLI